jgi:hypothetical protein
MYHGELGMRRRARGRVMGQFEFCPLVSRSRKFKLTHCQRPGKLFHESGRLAFIPGVVGLREEDAFIERGMIVEPDFYGFGGGGFG